ncbi:DUF2325 domain-containing protein [Burkholderiaceae bacterium DAT-1]|nr:DUF2325 domain-containing protein [Burkholderiaceae bacterium DAT-1]
MAAWREQVPDLDTRQRLAERVADLESRLRDRHTQILQLERELSVVLRRVNVSFPVQDEEREEDEAVASLPALSEKKVMCVGGRGGLVAAYRQLIQRAGGSFAFHDGGVEQNLNQLEPGLAAADLVICQTGCISHDAYWRVKDFCKRTGKQCVFVERPGKASLQRVLVQLFPHHAEKDNQTHFQEARDAHAPLAHSPG